MRECNNVIKCADEYMSLFAYKKLNEIIIHNKIPIGLIYVAHYYTCIYPYNFNWLKFELHIL